MNIVCVIGVLGKGCSRVSLNPMKYFLKKILFQYSINPLVRGGLRRIPLSVAQQLLKRIPEVRIVEMPVPGTNFRIKILSDPRDSVGQQLLQNGISRYEPELTGIFSKLVKDKHVFLDIGANCGLYSLLACSVNQNLKTYAFEPEPKCFSLLQVNRKINRLQNLTIIQRAVTDRSGILDFHTPDNHDHLSTMSSLIGQDSGCAKDWKTVQVVAITVDEFVRRNNIPGIDLMKVDVEKAEPLVLSGARESIRRFRPLIICEVLAHAEAVKIEEILKELNHRFYLITKNGLNFKDRIEPHSQYLNYLFSPQEISPGMFP